MCASPLHVELAGEGGVCVVSFSGGMEFRDHVLVRDAVLRTAVTCPTAVVVDLTAFAAVPPTAAAAALAVRAQVADWPGTPILLAGAEDTHQWGLPRHVSVAAAVAAVDRSRPPPMALLAVPRSYAAGFACEAAEKACWARGRGDVAAMAGRVAWRMVALLHDAVRPTIAFDWRPGLLVVVVGDDEPVPCGLAEVGRIAAAGPVVRCGWSGTWSGGSVIWAAVHLNGSA
ncbi:hypothetical protein GCM10010492_58710 [Saccharothrix mutabilis subsp. mutabilis]|uniref:STAS domain-containing protein n=1 Tax=Saccharothrix mutabilis subsp. mutabilis TaxID=66855 RepID=A0ABP3E5V8_9PSEU